MIAVRLVGARVLGPQGWQDRPVTVAEGVFCDMPAREVDLRGFDLLPGIVDIHGDAFERHMAPRRGALRERDAGMWAVAQELASCGITTAVLAQFWSWEGGMRGPEFAEEVFRSVVHVAPSVPIDLRLQMRIETHFTDSFAQAEQAMEKYNISYVVFNDHLPHERLAAGRTPKRLTGQALKSGRSPEAHLAFMKALHGAGAQVPAALDALCARLAARGVIMGSHDEQTTQEREIWRGRGVHVSEFPETMGAAQAASSAGESVIFGAPNMVRGASHAGNVAAADVIANGFCDALASDYHYPSLARAAWRCVELGLLDEASAWALISSGPARILGLRDRGQIKDGMRADLVIKERATGRIFATLARGHVAYMSGEVAERFFG